MVREPYYNKKNISYKAARKTETQNDTKENDASQKL